jgi:hypothetical protein
VGIVDEFMSKLKRSGKQVQSSSGLTKSKAKKMQSMPKTRMNSEINKATGKVTGDINKAKPKL